MGRKNKSRKKEALVEKLWSLRAELLDTAKALEQWLKKNETGQTQTEENAKE